MERLVDEGAKVKAGDLIARLDDTDQKLAVATAQANLTLAQAALARASKRKPSWRTSPARKARSIRQDLMLRNCRTEAASKEIADVQSAVDRAVAASQAAQTQLDQAKSDYDRYTNLFNQGVVSAQDYDKITTAYKTAQSGLDQANTQVSSAKDRLSLAQEGPRREEVDRRKPHWSRLRPDTIS